MNRQQKTAVAIVLAAVVVVSSLAIYWYMALNPLGSNGAWQRPLQNFATGLVADNNEVYVSDIFGNVNAFSAQTGVSVWNSSADTGYFAGALVGSSDRVYGGGAGASVTCLDKGAGAVKWSFRGEINTDLWTKRAPDAIIVSNRVVASVDGGVSVHDIDTGAFLWQASRPYTYPPVEFGNLTDLKTWWVAAYPLGGNPFEGNCVYVLSGNFSDPCISKFNFQTRSFAWNSSITLTDFPIIFPEAGPGHSGNAVSVIDHYQGEVIIQNRNQILCLNDSSGSQLWSKNIAETIYQPTISGANLFFGASDGHIYALSLSDGTQLWAVNVDYQKIMATVNGGNITASAYPIQVDNGRLYWSFAVTHQLGASSGDKHDTLDGVVCCLDVGNGDVLWDRAYEDNGALYGPQAGMVANKGTIYLTENTALWMFNAANGDLIDFQNFDHYVLPPVKSGNQVFVAANLQLTAY